MINENIATDPLPVHRDLQTTGHVFCLQRQLNTEVRL